MSIISQPHSKQPLRVGLFRVFSYTLLIIGALISLLPFLWMILAAFKTSSEINQIPPTFWPRQWVIENIVQVWQQLDFLRMFANSIFVAVTTTVFTLYTSALVGYVLAKFKFPGRSLIFFFIVSQMFIPGQLGMIVLWFIFFKVNLLDTYPALIIPSLYSSFGIFMMRQYMHTIPNELLDAARIDGASELGIFHKIVLPNIGAPLSALGIFTFIWNYDSFTWPLIVLNSVEMYTVPLGLALFQGQYFSNLARTMAGTAIAVIPSLIVFVLFQRRIVEGITLTDMGQY